MRPGPPARHCRANAAAASSCPASLDAPRAPRTARAKWRRRAGAVAFGLVLLCAAELALELADYGGPTAIFVKVPEGDGTESYVTNLKAFRSTFAVHPVIRAQGIYPAPPPQRFPAQKPPGSYRICVIGGSAAMGFPHRNNGSFPLFLQSILNTVCAGRRFEVVNVGVSAVGSYSLLQRIEEVLDYGADMVVVYSGHNEFYGAYGAASAIPLSSRRPFTLAQLWLRRRGLSMAMADLAAQSLPRPPEPALRQHLAQLMPRRTDVRYQDEAYARVRASYEANLESIVRAAQRRGVPIVLCTLGANLRDFPPLGSLPPAHFPDTDRVRWRQSTDKAEGLMRSGKIEEAAAAFRSALQAAPGHAATHYRLARCLDQLGRHREALAHYDAARNHDTVRWRAGADFNDVIHSVARQADAPGVILADAAAWLESIAPDGIPGSESFLEHVHLTLEGNFAIAEAAARAIGDSPAGKQLGDWDWTKHKPFGHYAALNDIDRFDLISALQQAAFIGHDLLSRDPAGRDTYGGLLSGIAMIEAGLSETERAALREAAGKADGYDRLYLGLAVAHQEQGRLEEALEALQKAQRYGFWQLDSRRYARLLTGQAALLLEASDAREAAAAAEKAVSLDPENAYAALTLSRAHRAAADRQDAEPRSHSPEAAGAPAGPLPSLHDILFGEPDGTALTSERST